MILLVSFMTTLAIMSCVYRCKQTKDYVSFKRSNTFKNFVIAQDEIGDYLIQHYMCKGKMFAYIHHNEEGHSYTQTPEISTKERNDKIIQYATFVTPEDENFQIVTKKVRRYAGYDSSFYNWENVPMFVKRKVLKAPKAATHIKMLDGCGNVQILDLKEKEE